MVLISIDTLRADHLQFYGYERVTAPKLGLIASESLVFEQAFSQAPKTAPSHMTMLTGLYPGSHGVRNLAADDNRALSPGIPTLAEILAGAGYRTGAVVGGAHVSSTLGFDRGFDDFLEEGWLPSAVEMAAELLIDYANRPSPFFLFFHTYSVHDPYVPPVEYQIFGDSAYAGGVVGTRTELEERSGKQWRDQHEVFWSAVERDSPTDLQRLVDLYDAGILFTDNLIGRLVAQLIALEIYDETLLIVVSDHGEEFLDHGGFLHETLYQEILRVPLLIRMPASRADLGRGARIGRRFRLVDLVPSVLDLVGVEASMPLQGRSFLSPAADSNGEGPTVLSEWPRADRTAIRAGQWKLISGASSAERELYDLSADPLELDNRIERHLERAAELERLQAWMLLGIEQRALELEPGPAVVLERQRQDELRALGYVIEAPR